MGQAADRGDQRTVRACDPHLRRVLQVHRQHLSLRLVRPNKGNSRAVLGCPAWRVCVEGNPNRQVDHQHLEQARVFSGTEGLHQRNLRLPCSESQADTCSCVSSYIRLSCLHSSDIQKNSTRISSASWHSSPKKTWRTCSVWN